MCSHHQWNCICCVTLNGSWISLNPNQFNWHYKNTVIYLHLIMQNPFSFQRTFVLDLNCGYFIETFPFHTICVLIDNNYAVGFARCLHLEILNLVRLSIGLVIFGPVIAYYLPSHMLVSYSTANHEPFNGCNAYGHLIVKRKITKIKNNRLLLFLSSVDYANTYGLCLFTNE